MNTCGTCRYFGEAKEDEFNIPLAFHVCRLIQQRTLIHPPKPRDVAVVVDSSDEYAALCVTKEFGCNQWAEKQPD